MPSLIEPVVMVTGTEIADRLLWASSINSARIGAKDLLFAQRSMLIGSFFSQNKYDYRSNILRINYCHVELQEVNHWP